MEWIDIFSAGTHTDMSGKTLSFGPADLDRMVQTLDPARHEPPLVLGHPKDDAPAFGWVSALRRQGDVLQAQFAQVPDTIREVVAKGRYKKRSIALYPDGRLRHVGLLGAAVPAVQGLADIAAFAAGEYVEFTETPTEGSMNPEELAKRVAALEAENALLKAKADGESAEKIAELEAKLKEAQAGKEKAEETAAAAEAAFAEAKARERRRELELKVDGLVKDGRLLPRDKAGALAFAERLDVQGDELQFAEGQGKKRVLDGYFEFLANLPRHGLDGEFMAPGGTGGGEAHSAIPYNDIMNKC